MQTKTGESYNNIANISQSTVNQRIGFLAESLERSVNAFSKKLNLSSSALYAVNSGKTHPSFEMISAIIVNYPFVNSKWLLTGAGEWNQTDEVLPDNTGFLNSVIKMKDEQLQSLRQEVELYRSKSSVNDSIIEAEVDGEKPLTYSLTCTSDMA